MRNLVVFCSFICLLFVVEVNSNVFAQANKPEYYIVAISPDETMIATVGTDFTFQILDSVRGTLLFSLSNLPVRPFSVVWNSKSTKIAAAGGDQVIRIWCTDMRSTPDCVPGTLTIEVNGHYGPLLALAWNNDGRLASVGQGEPQNFRIWDSYNNFEMIGYSGFSANQLAWHPTQNQLAVAIGGEGVYVISGSFKIDASANKVTNISALSIAWSSDGSRLAFGAENGYIYVVDLLSEITIAEFSGHTSEVYALAWSPDNTKLASSERTGKIVVWDITSEEGYPRDVNKNIVSNLHIDWSTTTGLIFADDTGIVGLGINTPPNAQAGNDQNLIDGDDDGLQTVTLNAGSSTDDVVIVDYSWSQNGVVVARGINPQITLPVGMHLITLTVKDDDGAMDTDEVVITVTHPHATDTPE